jgi:flagellar protein FlaI
MNESTDNPTTPDAGDSVQTLNGIGGDTKHNDADQKDDTTEKITAAAQNADTVADAANAHTVNTTHQNEDEFFTTSNGDPTTVTRYDLEKVVPDSKKTHFREIDRYWVNKPYAFVIVFYSEKEHERKYYVIEPYLNANEEHTKEFLHERLRDTIRYSDTDDEEDTDVARARLITRYVYGLLERYGMENAIPQNINHDTDSDGNTDNSADGVLSAVRELFASFNSTTDSNDEEDTNDTPTGPESIYNTHNHDRGVEGVTARPEQSVVSEDTDTLTPHQLEKILYYLKRDFVGYGPIDAVKRDISIEDISCDGYGVPVFVYHSEYEQIITNIRHTDNDQLDSFVVKLAQRSGMGISKREPQVDVTLPDGSRSQLTLGTEVSGHGTNYTIRQFLDVPNTPIDLINWGTFSLDEMAFLWLAIENNQSMVFAGGTASGKTTSLNAVSLFIPSGSKIVSIEDTRELELPQQNWISSVTRLSFAEGADADVDEFDLLEAALRQRPEYILMGEVRGEEGRTLFQVMSTGHTTYTTFHADSVEEVIKRFTTDPINVSKTLFTALDLIAIQTQTRVNGTKVRRVKGITEINDYQDDQIVVGDIFNWDAATDTHHQTNSSSTLDNIQQMRGWDRERIDVELLKRKVVLAHLIRNGLNTYTQVAATIQGYLNNPDMILDLIANDELGESLSGLQEIESVLIDIDPEKEEMVPRPDAGPDIIEETEAVINNAHDTVLAGRTTTPTHDIERALPDPRDVTTRDGGVTGDIGDSRDGNGASSERDRGENHE